MAAMTWYELFPHRLVLETIRVRSSDSSFLLKRLGGTLYWEGRALEIPEGAEAPPLHFLVVYPEAFPATPPGVEIISPELSSTEWGHEWHRWWNGNVCYVRPSRWQVSSSADEIIKKVGDWYFNYVAKKQGMITKMPDVGRAKLPVRKIEYGGSMA
jgi:hypothetical protein